MKDEQRAFDNLLIELDSMCDLKPKHERIVRKFRIVFRFIYDISSSRGKLIRDKLKNATEQATP